MFFTGRESMQQTNEEIERIIKGPHKYEEGKGYYSVPLEELGYPAWRYHSEAPPRLVKDAEEDRSLGPGWRHTPNAQPRESSRIMEAAADLAHTEEAVRSVSGKSSIEEFIGTEPKRKPGRPKKDK